MGIWGSDCESEKERAYETTRKKIENCKSLVLIEGISKCDKGCNRQNDTEFTWDYFIGEKQRWNKQSKVIKKN